MNNLYLFILIPSLVLPYAVFLTSDHQSIISLVKEDGIIQSYGAICFFVASIVCFVTFWKSKSGTEVIFYKRRKNIFFLLLGILLFVGFGEEISWGQRMFGLETPDILKEYNMQNEITIHNLSIFQREKQTVWSSWLNPNRLFNLFWLSFCLVVPVLNRVSRRISYWIKRVNIPIIPIWIGGLFMGNYIIFKFLEKIPENGPRIHHALVEMKESNFAVLFVIVSLYLFQKHGNE